MKLYALLTSAVVMIAGCTNFGDPGPAPLCSPLGGSAPGTQSAINILPVTVGLNYVNEITVAVTICEPANPTNCQTIPNVLLDTGSNGLRLFSCVVSLNLQPQLVNGPGTDPVAECVTYADTTSHWGAIKLANVTLGAETATNVPIQIVDPNYATAPSTCTKLEGNPLATGYNGIVGVGLFSNDCPQCATNTNTLPAYYTCSGSTCTASTLDPALQVTNPVAKMPTDNNGLNLYIPPVGNSGAASISGTLTLGIATATGNNTPPGSPVIMKADASLNMQTKFNGQFYTAFIDSGSNALYFPSTGTTPTCDISGFTLYCPPSPTVGLTATQYDNTLTVSNAVPFTITDANAILNGGNRVYSTYGGVMPTTFDWGLPFYMGRTIYVGIDGTSSPLGASGRLWAY